MTGIGVHAHLPSQENHVATYIPGGAKDWDRGIHVLVGEERFRGSERGGYGNLDAPLALGPDISTVAQAWLRSIHHYIFLADPRADHAIGEPKLSNGAIVQVSLGTKMHVETVSDINKHYTKVMA